MMKKFYLIIMVSISIFLLGCNNFSKLTSEEAIYKVFEKYDSNKKSGLVGMHNKDGYTHLYYISSVESVNKLNTLLEKENLSKEEEKNLENLSTLAMKEISKDVLNKVEKLYNNENVENVTIHVGVIVDDKEGGISPGEDVTKEPIVYLQYFEFTREKIKSIDWENLDRENYYKNL